MSDELISRESLLKGIAELKESPWYNFGKADRMNLEGMEALWQYGYQQRKEAIQVIEEVCINKEPAVTIGSNLTDDSGWISVKDRLPKEYDSVLLVTEVTNSFIFSKTDRVITIGRLKPSGKWQTIGVEYLDMEITHWRTLPALPKGE